eukprot:4619174-Pyramimonas_sp.AAC.1
MSHRELHRRPHSQRAHAVPLPFRCTPHTLRGPIRGSTEGPSGSARMAVPPHFGTPFTRSVAP